MNPDVARLLDRDGVIARTQHPQLRRSIDGYRHRGVLACLLPGVYARPDQQLTWRHWALAACLFSHDVILTEEVAAALGFWRRLTAPRVSAYHSNAMADTTAITWHRNRVPEEWVVTRGDLRFAAPAWAAMELAGQGRSDAIDEALRCGVRLKDLHRALEAMHCRPGNNLRRQLLKDSRDQPWSPAERLGHQRLRESGITGWRTNHQVAGYYLDIAFLAEKVGIEIDGYEFHSGNQAFQADRYRDQVLAANGWIIIRVTWAQLQDDWPGVLARLRAVLRQRRPR